MSGEVLAPVLAFLSVLALAARAEVRRRAAVVARGVGQPRTLRGPAHRSGGRRDVGGGRRRARPPRWTGRRRSDGDLGDVVAAVAAALRAGLSLPQALSYAAEEAEGPIRSRLEEAVERVRYGERLDAALSRWAAGGGEDDRLVCAALLMHRRTGGDLPAVLDRIAATLRERAAARAELRSLTAQARLSGAVLGLLPVGFFLFLALTSPSDIAAALRSPSGRAAIGAGLALQAVAFAWIRRILRVA
ncbi:MAG TPA: type II secretion system F family protein [Actinomycetota bacterium]|nr:type II secretion system F family protein [Actinomycetota bacterium]